MPTMVSSLHLPVLNQFAPTLKISDKFRSSQRNLNLFTFTKPTSLLSSNNSSSSSSSSPNRALRNSVPFAASLALILWSNPVSAGILSGFSGIESMPGPQLPQIDFLNKFNEENQKKYAEFDERFKSSPLLKRLLEQSKLNKEKNKQEVMDKYCLRGAEWGVGICSTDGMNAEDRENFISMLKKKAGAE